MMRIWQAAVLVLPLLATGLHAESPDPFEAKVQALGHPRYAEREKAARELLAAGEPAMKALRAAASSSDPEVRTRAAAIAERIDRALRSQRLLVAPKLAIKLHKVPLKVAVTEVATKSGLRFQLDPGKDTDLQRQVSLDTGELPFWDAIAAFYAAAGLVENDMPASDAVGMSEKEQLRRIYTTRLGAMGEAQGVIRLTDAKSVSANVSNTAAATGQAIRVRALPAVFPQNKYDAATGEVTIHLDVDAAPALTVQELIGIEVRRAKTDNRQVLAPVYPPAQAQLGLSGYDELIVARQILVVNGDMVINDGLGTGNQYFGVTLKGSGTRPRQLSTLEGVVVARVVAPPESLVSVDDIFDKGKGRSASVNGLTLTVQSVDDGSASGQPIVRLRVVSRPDVMSEFLNFPVQVRGRVRQFVRINRTGREPVANPSEFVFKDANGKPVKVLSTRAMSSTFDGVTMTQEIELRIEKPANGTAGMNLSMTGRRPALVEMPFVLKDVQLP